MIGVQSAWNDEVLLISVVPWSVGFYVPFKHARFVPSARCSANRAIVSDICGTGSATTRASQAQSEVRNLPISQRSGLAEVRQWLVWRNISGTGRMSRCPVEGEGRSCGGCDGER